MPSQLTYVFWSSFEGRIKTNPYVTILEFCCCAQIWFKECNLSFCKKPKQTPNQKFKIFPSYDYSASQNGTFINCSKYISSHCLKQHKKYMEWVKTTHWHEKTPLALIKQIFALLHKILKKCYKSLTKQWKLQLKWNIKSAYIWNCIICDNTFQ